ncbi:SDR family oxidoreductase [Ferrimonas senticii]|uniref:SDR family oxidoreductase n=1 Tax=Ferrimonas senticii TaxID=394566 RepID=UPI00041EB253|nr:SDR family oxidoreductase [Ferrimonas senticii]
MATVLITGANRGLGFEFVRQYAAANWQVIATCRDPQQAAELSALAQAHSNIQIEALAVTDEHSINALAAKLAGQPIDLLLNNAGVLGDDCDTWDKLDQQRFLDVLNINTVAPALMIKAFKAHVIASERKAIVGISSRIASIDDNGSGNMLAYRTSKVGLNQLLRCASRDLAEYGVKTLALHPGWVQTDMGGSNATFTTEESVRGMIERIDELDETNSGTFVVFNGEQLPW